jgi:hypothetical protein
MIRIVASNNGMRIVHLVCIKGSLRSKDSLVLSK